MSHSHQTHMNVPTFDVFITTSADGVCATAKNAIVWFFTFSLKHLFIIFSLSLSIMFCFWFEFGSLLFGLHFTIERIAVYPNCQIERTNTYERCRYFWHTLLEILMPFVLIVFSSLWNTPNAKQFCNLLVLPSLVFVFLLLFFIQLSNRSLSLHKNILIRRVWLSSRWIARYYRTFVVVVSRLHHLCLCFLTLNTEKESNNTRKNINKCSLHLPAASRRGLLVHSFFLHLTHAYTHT